jgi:hypothetical protein
MPPKEPLTWPRPRTLKGKDEARKQGLITGFVSLKHGRPPRIEKIPPAKQAVSPAKQNVLPPKKKKVKYTDWKLEANKLALEAAVKANLDGLPQPIQQLS